MNLSPIFMLNFLKKKSGFITRVNTVGSFWLHLCTKAHLIRIEADTVLLPGVAGQLVELCLLAEVCVFLETCQLKLPIHLLYIYTPLYIAALFRERLIQALAILFYDSLFMTSEVVVWKDVWGSNTYFHSFSNFKVTKQCLLLWMAYLYSWHSNQLAQINLLLCFSVFFF